MCQHFCFGGIMLIIVFTIVFAIAIYFNVRREFIKYSDRTNEEDLSFNTSAPELHVISNSGLKFLFNSIKTCELLYNSTTTPVADNDDDDKRRENFVPTNRYANNFPLVVQLNYRTKGNNIENLCNGVAIHTNYILTLAQCLIDNGDRELISVTSVNDTHYKISNIIIYDEYMNHNNTNNIGLIQIEHGVELANRFCVRRLQNSSEILSNGLKLTTCSTSNQPNRVCVDSIRTARLGDPLVEQHNGVWYLIGLYQANNKFPMNISIYTDVYLYKNWITNTIQSVT